MTTTVRRPSPFQTRKREKLKLAIEEALNEDSRYKTLATLVELGVTVMIAGRPPEVAEMAETKRWLVELELFPICIVEEHDGTEMEALRNACSRFIMELERRFPNPRPGEPLPLDD